MYDLIRFNLSDSVMLGKTLRNLGRSSTTFEETADKIAHLLYAQLIDPQTGQPACALVRFYKTHNYANLDQPLQHIAQRSLGQMSPNAAMKCLVLLGTAGDRPTWNVRTQSVGHQVIPLPSEEIVAQSPMIAQLILQLGLPLNVLIQPDPALLADLTDKRYKVFYVPQALGSPFIPAQEFVIRYGLQSVLGFGGLLASGDLFAVILFSRVIIAPEKMVLFKEIAMDAKVAVDSFVQNQTFKTS